PENELAMLNLPHNGIAPDMLGEVRPLLGVVGLDKARQELMTTEVSDAIGRYIVALGRRTRDMPGVELGVSSRAMIHLMSASKASARLNGRHVVTIDDVREMVPYVLRHRMILSEGASADEVLQRAMDSVPAPLPSRVGLA
ncbi:MAG: MoxR family ATPase, partial [Actinomycetota bacterium]|nr:MoxR family ATPase [Actinomycetota bacterium]